MHLAHRSVEAVEVQPTSQLQRGDVRGVGVGRALAERSREVLCCGAAQQRLAASPPASTSVQASLDPES